MAAARGPSTAAFVAKLTEVPTGSCVSSAASALRLRLVRTQELLQSVVVQLDAAHAEAQRRAAEAEDVRQEMQALRERHMVEVKEARKEASARHEVAKQATKVRPAPPATYLCSAALPESHGARSSQRESPS